MGTPRSRKGAVENLMEFYKMYFFRAVMVRMSILQNVSFHAMILYDMFYIFTIDSTF